MRKLLVLFAAVTALTAAAVFASTPAPAGSGWRTVHWWGYNGCQFNGTTLQLWCGYGDPDWGGMPEAGHAVSFVPVPIPNPCETTTICEPPPAQNACKPGYGYGDENHCHDGPPGRE